MGRGTQLTGATQEPVGLLLTGTQTSGNLVAQLNPTKYNMKPGTGVWAWSPVSLPPWESPSGRTGWKSRGSGDTGR